MHTQNTDHVVSISWTITTILREYINICKHVLTIDSYNFYNFLYLCKSLLQVKTMSNRLKYFISIFQRNGYKKNFLPIFRT